MTNQTNNNEQNILRSILRSEVTWVISIVVVVWSFVTTVVLPIQKLQINVEDIKLQLAKESERYIDTEGRVTILEKNQAVVMSKLSLNKVEQ